MTLAEHAEHYVTFRRALGYSCEAQAQCLQDYATYAGACGDSFVRTSTVLDWASTAPSPRQDAADPDAGAVNDLLDTAALLDQGPPMTAQAPCGTELHFRHQARTTQTELADRRQPATVLDVRLAALELLDMLGMEQLRPDPGLRV